MKKYFLLVLVLPLLSISTSCSSDDDTNHSAHQNPLQKFQGTWSGTYSGEDTGDWQASIDANGNANGTINRVNSTAKYTLTGSVNKDGAVNMTYYFNNQPMGSMSGTMSESNGSGTWINTLLNFEGIWTGNKK